MTNLGSIKRFAKKVKESQEINSFPEEKVVTVAGVTFENRQNLLRFVTQSTKFKLERDRSNPYDFYAVKVKALINGIWSQLGFIPKAHSKEISALLDSSVNLSVCLECLNGFQVSDTEMDPKGLNISIRR